jgi:hypothetical protein
MDEGSARPSEVHAYALRVLAQEMSRQAFCLLAALEQEQQEREREDGQVRDPILLAQQEAERWDELRASGRAARAFTNRGEPSRLCDALVAWIISATECHASRIALVEREQPERSPRRIRP